MNNNIVRANLKPAPTLTAALALAITFALTACEEKKKPSSEAADTPAADYSDLKTLELNFGFKVTAGKSEEFKDAEWYDYFKLERNNNVVYLSNDDYEFDNKRYPMLFQTGDNSFELLFEVNGRPGDNLVKRLFVSNDKVIGEDELPLCGAEPKDINNDGIKVYECYWGVADGGPSGRPSYVTYHPAFYYSVTKTGLKLDSALTKQRNEIEYGQFYGFDNRGGYEIKIEVAAAESGSGVKLLESMTTTSNDDGQVQTVKFEYDSKDRIVKIHITYSGDDENTETLHYNGDKLIKKTSKSNDYNEDYNMEDDMIVIPSEVGPFKLKLNRDGYIDYRSGTYGSTAYSYQNGNLVKSNEEAGESSENVEKSESIYKYDSKNSPFLNCKTPKWFLQYYGYIETNANNLTRRSDKSYDSANNLTRESETTYAYEYDSDGFPTKRTETVKSDGVYIATTTFTYIGKQ